MSERVRVGVVGCGLVAQVMHLPYLRELSDLFEVVAVCDISPTRVEAVGAAYGVSHRSTAWEDLVAEPLDAILVLTNGNHVPIASAAVRAGRHVFVEKPLCLSVAEGRGLVREADAAGVRLMVGYMKRYDPAYERLARELPALGPLRYVRLTTLESPLEPYVGHYPFSSGEPPDPGLLRQLQADDVAVVREAIGDVRPDVAHAYRDWLLDSMVHELNAIRGLLGDPDRIDFARIRPEGITAILRFGEVECVASWVELPGMARYRQEWAFVASDRRALLEFPSPFLRSAPTAMILEDGTSGSSASSRSEHVLSYEEAFKRELQEFHAAIVDGRPPRTTGEDALKDVALCAAIVAAHVEGRPIDDPTSILGRR